MQSESPLAVCTFGWGKVFRLYHDRLDVQGTQYALRNLTDVHLAFQRMLGIDSARLELEFGKKKLVLPGIAEVEEARKAAAYLIEQIRERRAMERVEMAKAVTAPVEIPAWTYEPHHQDAGTDSGLPEVTVPLRMLPGERAHYITDATRCTERSGGAVQMKYPALDQGMLILTSRRVIYIGRKGQLTLDYVCLQHITRLRGGIALQADHWQKPAIFEMRRPLECATYLEYIVERFHRETSEHICPVLTA